MYSERLLRHFTHPYHAGEMAPPAVTVEAMNPVCGDILRISVEWVDGAVLRAGFQARGCTASIAAGSALAEWLEGKTRADLGQFTPALLEGLLDGLPAESKHAAVLAADAVNRLRIG